VVLFFAHIPFVVNRTFNAMSTERLQHYISSNAGTKAYRTLTKHLTKFVNISY